ncbi:E3 ubiquitin-protein ligase ATL6-like [Oryza brachyantha]|nr:E3 ubiquitin-protein ligase ATL6-like [Oryza brachyantha]
MGVAYIAASVLLAIAPGAAAQSPRTGSDESLGFADVISISFFMAVFFPVFVVLLAFACLRLFRPLDEEPPLADTSSSEWSRRGSKAGLDAAEIAALPLVSYRDVKQHRTGDDALECAVCLLEFDDDDALRLLPACPHAFHPECIGLWLEKHVTCPLCRANVLDAPPPPPPPPPSPPPVLPQQETMSPPVHEMVVVIGDAGANEEADERTRTQCLARMRRAAGRQALPRSNSTGHERGGGVERFALRLPEHVRLEILMSHRLRHVTSAVESVRVREGSAHDAGPVRTAVARLLSLFVPGAGWKGDDEGKSGKADGSPHRRRDESARGGGASN